jgi:hypothetical protein
MEDIEYLLNEFLLNDALKLIVDATTGVALKSILDKFKFLSALIFKMLPLDWLL